MRERTFRRDQCENTLDRQFIQPRRSIGHPDDAEALAGLDGSGAFTLITASFPDTPDAITSDDLFQAARSCVPNLHKTPGEE